MVQIPYDCKMREMQGVGRGRKRECKLLRMELRMD